MPEHAAPGDTGAAEGEDLVRRDDVALDPRDLGDAHDAPRPVREPRDLHDHVDGRRDLLAQRAHRETGAGEHHHVLEARERVTRRVGVDRRHRALVAGVHRLEHVHRLDAAHLADDDAIRPHAERVADKIARHDLAASLDVRRAGLEPHDVLLLQPQLRRVLDRHDALRARDERAQRVEQRRLSRPGAAGDEDVQPRVDTAREQRRHAARQGPARGQRLDVEVRAEAPDREHGPVERERRDDRVDARAVGEARVDHWRRLVHAPADAAHDAVDHRQQVRVVAERGVHPRQAAAPFDVDVLRAVDEDVGDRRVAEERLDRPQPGDLVDDLLDDLLALRGRQRRVLGAEELGDRLANLDGELPLVGDLLERLEVEPIDETTVHVQLELIYGA
jgi:hypothetical protein